jgi:hypothetical protein
MCSFFSRSNYSKQKRVRVSIVRVIKIRWDTRGSLPRAVFLPNVQKQSLKNFSDGTGCPTHDIEDRTAGGPLRTDGDDHTTTKVRKIDEREHISVQVVCVCVFASSKKKNSMGLAVIHLARSFFPISRSRV